MQANNSRQAHLFSYCVYTWLVYNEHMKTILVPFRATPDERKRWSKALKSEGKTLSEVCRAALNRFAKRVEKKESEDD